MKALLIVSLAAALMATSASAQSFDLSGPTKSFERAVSRLTDAGNKAVRRIDAGFASVERRHNSCEKRADGSGAVYLDCFVVRPIANSDGAVAMRSWGESLRRQLASL